jgi:predicted amidohydrolase
VRVAAYQAPLLAAGSMDALGLIRARVEWCEAEGVTILCCPEAVLGGLADHGGHPSQFAFAADAGRLDSALSPLTSDTVTTIVGFTELADEGRLYNSAAIFQRGSVVGLYRKLYPAIHRSVYQAGCKIPVFQAGEMTFGIVICNDSNYFEPARLMAAQGATALFVPTNNGLAPATARPEHVAQTARNVDIARAVENGMWVIRADVAGRTDELLSYGSSGIVDPDGMVAQSARPLSEDLIVAEIDIVPRARRGWDASRNRAVMREYAAHVAASVTAYQD